ncbi:hypothetical protein [Sulfurimonas sp.]|uniref:hypothetical protein n=1 Tax=Sulfurimonas sp. TaxID=2022749 RepID=UPI0019E0AAC2|nr:hypothetical protein [Sulfurimonas sp.]MBE0514983.1 hypothetical protein [Sulfurimonas sp.]
MRRAWLYEEHRSLFENITGSKLTKEESEFLKSYFNPLDNLSKGKHLYYLSVYRLKRFYPRSLVYLMIKKTLKNDFASENLDSLVLVHDHFAKHMLNEVVKAFCKLSV